MVIVTDTDQDATAPEWDLPRSLTSIANARKSPHAGTLDPIMAWPVWVSGPLRLALVQLAGAALLLGVIQIAFVLEAGPPVTTGLLFVGVGWLYVAVGLLAWSRRPSNRFGSLIVFGGFVLIVTDLGISGVPVLVAGGAIVATVPLAVLVHVLHAFPSGRLPSRASRLIVMAGYLVCLVLQAPLYLFTARPAPYDVLVLADRPDWALVAFWVQVAAGSTVMLATTTVLIGRLRVAEPGRRRRLAPLFGYGIFAVLFIPLASNVLGSWLGLPSEGVKVLQLVDVAGVPVAFTLGLLRGGFAQTGELEQLGSWLSTAEPGRSPVASALARALGDDSVRLIYWMPDRTEYVDVDGNPAQLPTVPWRAVVEIEMAGTRIGAIDYDTTLNADAGPVRAAGRVIALAVAHDRVTAELRASEQALRRSRARLVMAGDSERRRIARDLHDGLQVRLVLLAMQAQEAAKDPTTSGTTQSAVLALRGGIDAAAAELRDLVHAVLPAALIERGLCAAVEDLVDHLPIPTRLEMTVPDHRLPPVVESTAYFVVAESLTNALKHAHAHNLSVCLSQTGDHLRIEVTDDGSGGANLHNGSGLRGLIDRVDTLGGRLHVQSPAGSGTRIEAEFSCASS